MAVNKLNGYAAPYRSQTFQKIAAAHVGQRGLLSMSGAVTEDSGVVIVPPFSFIQNGLIVERTVEKQVPLPVDLPAPYYLTVTSPTPAPTEDLAFQFAKAPGDVSENEVVIAEFDGLEWRRAPLLSIGAVLEHLRLDNIDAGRVGPQAGLRTTFEAPNYVLSPGTLIDSQGEKAVCQEDLSLFRVEDDPEAGWRRVDRVVYRRALDDRRRIGTRKLLTGLTFTDTPTLAAADVLFSATYPPQMSPVALVNDVNQVFALTAAGYGSEWLISMARYAADRSQDLTALVAEATSPDFAAAVDPAGYVHIVYVSGNDLRWVKVDEAGAPVAGPTTIANAGDICRMPRVAIDAGGSTVFVVYERLVGPSNSQIFLTSLTLDGSTMLSPRNLNANSSNLLSPDLAVTEDLTLHVVWEDAVTEKIYYGTFDPFGVVIEAPITVSGETESDTYGPRVDLATAPRIVVTTSGVVTIAFLQEVAAGLDGVTVWQNGAARVEQWLSAGGPEDLTYFDLAVDDVFAGVHLTIGRTDRVVYVKVEAHEKVFELELSATGTEAVASVLDRTGSLFHIYTDPDPETYSVYENGTVANIGPATVVGAEDTVELTSSQLLIPAGSVASPPFSGGRLELLGSSAGNDGTYEIVEVSLVSVGTVDDHYLVQVDSAFAAAESPATGVTADLLAPDGYASRVVKSVAEVIERAYRYSGDPADVLLSRISVPGPNVLNYDPAPGRQGTRMVLGTGVTVGWEVSGVEELTVAGGLKVLDLRTNVTYAVQDETFSIANGEALFVVIDDTDLTPTAQVASINDLPLGERIEVLGVVSGGQFHSSLLLASGVGSLDSGEQVVLGEDLPQELRSKLGFMSETSIAPYTSMIGYLQTSNFPEAISQTNIMAGQNKHIRLVGGKVGWDGSELEFVGHAYLQVPGLPETRNGIAPQLIAIDDDEVAYVTINREEGLDANLTVSVAPIEAVALGRNTVIIARSRGNGHLLLESSGIELKSGHEVSLGRAHAASVEVTSGNLSGTLSPSDSTVQAALETIDVYFKALQLREYPDNQQRVVLTGASVNKTDGTVLGQTAKDLVVKFEGAQIDFSSGFVFAADGITLLSMFAVPTVAAGQYRWFSIALQASTLLSDNRINMAVSVVPAEADGADLDTAPRAKWKGDIKIGQVALKRLADDTGFEDIFQADIVQLGVGSGAGGGGAGGDPSFTLSNLAGSTATLTGGAIQLEDGRVLVTGSGTTSDTVGADNDIDVDLDAVLGSAPDDATTYYLAIDLYALGEPVVLTDDGREVYQVYDASHFKLLTAVDLPVNRYRYVLLQLFRSATVGNEWSGLGSLAEDEPRRLYPQTIHSPIMRFSAEMTTEDEQVFSHGLDREPTVIDIRYFDGVVTKVLPLGSHLLSVDDSTLVVSSYGLTFGSGEKLTIRAYLLDAEREATVHPGTQWKSGWFTDTATTTVAHTLSDMEDIADYAVVEWDTVDGLRRVIPGDQLITGYDDQNFYLDWTGLSPSPGLRYRIVAGGTVMQAAYWDSRYNKVVGYGPGAYPTLAAANLQPGDSVLVNRDYVSAVSETISVDDVRIEFQPEVDITYTGSAKLTLAGSRITLVDAGLRFEGTARTSGISIEAAQCFIERARVTVALDSGETLADVFAVAAGVTGCIVTAVVENTGAGDFTRPYQDLGANNALLIKPEVPQPIVTAPQTLDNSPAAILADTSGGGFTLTLPANPWLGLAVTIYDVAWAFGTNSLVLARNGKLIQGLAEDLSLDISGSKTELVFAGDTLGWRVF